MLFEGHPIADNYTTNAGAGGDTFAADDVGPGVKYPYVKLDLGGNGVSSPVSTALPVSQSGSWSISITGTVAATQSGAWSVTLGAGTANIGDVDVLTVNGVAPAFGSGVRGATVQRVTIATDDVVPASQSGTWTVQPGNTQNTTPWLVKEGRSGTGTTSQVNDSASSVTILASNSSRLGATVYNDSSALLYLRLSAGTATSTDYSARVYPNGYFEVPANYTGAIVGIWATDPNDGAARVTEFT